MGEAVFTAEIQLEDLLALEEGIPEKLFTDEELEENRLQLKSSETVPEAMKKVKKIRKRKMKNFFGKNCKRRNLQLTSWNRYGLGCMMD